MEADSPVRSSSSPPTRGCSASYQSWLVDHTVLPADAGVFRTPKRQPAYG